MSQLPIGGDGDDLFHFPCSFPLKIIGHRSDDFVQTVRDILLQHVPDFSSEEMEMRASSGGKYLSITCTFMASSRIQLDGLYQALSRHPAVTMVL